MKYLWNQSKITNNLIIIRLIIPVISRVFVKWYQIPNKLPSIKQKKIGTIHSIFVQLWAEILNNDFFLERMEEDIFFKKKYANYMNLEKR